VVLEAQERVGTLESLEVRLAHELLYCAMNAFLPPPPSSEEPDGERRAEENSEDSGAQGIYEWEDILYFLRPDEQINAELGPSRGLCGLRNIGNTCYMNSALQCLSNTESLRRVFLGPRPLIATTTRSPVLKSLAIDFVNLSDALWGGAHRSFSPIHIHHRISQVNPLFRGYAQHDSQEFLRTLLDSLHEALKRNDYDRHALELAVAAATAQSSSSTALASSNGSSSHKKSPQTSNSPKTTHSTKHAANKPQPAQKPVIPTESSISALFEGKLLSTVECGNCHRKSETLDRFFDLSLPIPSSAMLTKISDRKQQISQRRREMSAAAMDVDQMDDFGTEVNGTAAQSSSGMFSRLWSWFSSSSSTDLETLLHGFCVADELTGPDQYRCEHCKLLHDATKTFTIAHLPHVLCLHIKRFKYDFFGSKMSDHVKFPLNDLNMADFCSKPTQPSALDVLAPNGQLGAGQKVENGVQTRKKKQISTPAPAVPMPANPLYNLYAVICHSGSLHGGHYYTYAKHSATGRWYEFNDSSVTEVSEATVEKAEAYVLFYEQQTYEEKIQERESIKREISEFLIERQKLDEAKDPGALPPDTPFVSLTWLVKWLSVNQPGPLNAPGLLCAHNRPVSSPLRHLVPLPASVAKRFEDTYGGSVYRLADSPCGGCEQDRLEHERKVEEEKRLQIALEERRETEKNQVTELGKLLSDPEETEKGYWFVDINWVKSWLEFVRGESDSIPGPIDNRSLLVNLPVTKAQGRYRALNFSVWQFLHKTYGGGPEIWDKKSSFPKSPGPKPSDFTTQSDTDDDTPSTSSGPDDST
jgi:ubiquitin carboxyl-terminal hydrolase 20/33